MDKKYPEVVVGCFILNDKDEILLVHSYKWPDKWVVMGGHIEFGETIADAVKREVKEEVGLDVMFTRVIEVVEFVKSKDFHNPNKHFIGLQSECRVKGNTDPMIDNNEIQETKWFTLKEAVVLPNILGVTRKTIQELIDLSMG